jgi:hypothetical protein
LDILEAVLESIDATAERLQPFIKVLDCMQIEHQFIIEDFSNELDKLLLDACFEELFGINLNDTD